MNSEIAIILSDNRGYLEISTVLNRRGVMTCHAGSLAELAQLEFLVPADMLVVDGKAGYAAGEGTLTCMPGPRSSQCGIFVRIGEGWAPDAGQRMGILAA